MGVKYIKRDGKTITIDTKTGKELKFGDRLKNKIRKGVINFSNKPFGLDYSKYKGTDQWDDKKKRFLTQDEVNKRDRSNLPNANKTSAAIRGEQKKNDKSNKNLKINKNEKQDVSKNNKKNNKKIEVDTKTAFSQDKSLLDKKDKNKKGKESKKDNLKIKKGSARNFIKTKKGFARRGTPMAKRAEEKEKARKKLAAKGYMKNK